MKLPNGYGSVYKLSGKRRRPWAARKTIGWSYDESTGKSFPEYKFVGYYQTKKEALEALAAYNEDPYGFQVDDIALGALYERWSEERFERLSENTVYSYKAAFRCFDEIKHMKVKDIKLSHLQQAIENSGKYKSTVELAKAVIHNMYSYGVKHEIVSTSKREMTRYIDLESVGNPNKIERIPFNEEEIAQLWKIASSSDPEETGNDLHKSAMICIILLYSGMRRNELLDLKKENVHVGQNYFDIVKAKTPTGIRQIPIHQKILPLVQELLEDDCDYLVCFKDRKKYNPTTFYKRWEKLMEHMQYDHHMHDTRHTFITRLALAGADQRVIMSLVGHKPGNITESVYTHIPLEVKENTINLLV